MDRVRLGETTFTGIDIAVQISRTDQNHARGQCKLTDTLKQIEGAPDIHLKRQLRIRPSRGDMSHGRQVKHKIRLFNPQNLADRSSIPNIHIMNRDSIERDRMGNR